MSFFKGKIPKIFLIIFLFSLVSSFCYFLIFRRNSFNLKSSLVSRPIYLFRRGREFFAGIFVFGDYDNTNWHITLAKKRLAEGEKLLSLHDFANCREFVLKSKEETKIAERYLKLAEEKGEDVNYLLKEMEEILLKQEKIVNLIKEK